MVTGNYGSSFGFWDRVCGTELDVNAAIKAHLAKAVPGEIDSSDEAVSEKKAQ